MAILLYKILIILIEDASIITIGEDHGMTAAIEAWGYDSSCFYETKSERIEEGTHESLLNFVKCCQYLL